MESITALVHDDPYLRMTPHQRVAEVKRRRHNFYGKQRPTLNPPPLIVVPPVDAIDPAVRAWINSNETFYHVMWFFDLIAFVDAPPRPPRPKYPPIEIIQRVVAHHYGVSRHDMLSERRTANVVRPRQVAMYLAKTMTLRSLPEIGRRFGGRDHTTVLHAVRKMEAMMGRDAVFAGEMAALQQRLMEVVQS